MHYIVHAFHSYSLVARSVSLYVVNVNTSESYVYTFVQNVITIFRWRYHRGVFFLSFFLFYFDTLSQYAVAFSMATTTNDTFPALFQCLIGVFIWFLFTALSYDTLFSSLRTLPNETISKLPFLRRVFFLFSSCFFRAPFLRALKVISFSYRTKKCW